MARSMDDEQRAAFLLFVQDVAAYLDDEDLAASPAHAVAVLVREAAVAAFVRGTMWGDGPVPPDTQIVALMRQTTEDHPDLYPAWKVLKEAHHD